MLWSVAGRFHFGETELWQIPIRRLQFWYRGHVVMYKEEISAIEAAKDKLDGKRK